MKFRLINIVISTKPRLVEFRIFNIFITIVNCLFGITRSFFLYKHGAGASGAGGARHHPDARAPSDRSDRDVYDMPELQPYADLPVEAVPPDLLR